jgi:hypothetical protein
MCFHSGWPDELVKKIAQSIAQSIFFQNDSRNFSVEKSSPKCGLHLLLKKLSKINNHSMGEHSPNLATLFPSHQNWTGSEKRLWGKFQSRWWFQLTVNYRRECKKRVHLFGEKGKKKWPSLIFLWGRYFIKNLAASFDLKSLQNKEMWKLTEKFWNLNRVRRFGGILRM